MNKGHEETQRVGTTLYAGTTHHKQGEIQVLAGPNVTLQLSLMFADKARAYPSEPPSRYSTTFQVLY